MSEKWGVLSAAPKSADNWGWRGSECTTHPDRTAVMFIGAENRYLCLECRVAEFGK